ncbi:MAG TPA: class I SAM-dependent methyltransferase [Vicinamibacterales bacterium]
MPLSVGQKVKRAAAAGGAWYSALFVIRAMVDRCRDLLDNRLAAIERRQGIVEPWTVSARRFTASDNRALYDSYDWGALGEEWTSSPAWKAAVVAECLLPNVPENGVALEIGPGGGRWTELLRQRARALVVVDVSARALDICRARFKEDTNIEYLLSDGGTLGVPDGSVDGIWSYDVFVHVNPVDARRYFREFHRVLKPKARAVIHHPGDQRVNPTRSDLTGRMVGEFCREAGLNLLSQTGKFASDKSPTDLISVVQKPA